MKDKIIIRGHHLLCINFFKGKGYNKKFISNFYDVVNEINDNGTIKLTNSVDSLCNLCPHNHHNRCIKKRHDSEEKVREKDSFILTNLKLRLGQDYDYSAIKMKILKKMPQLREICIDCEWLDYCQ